MNVSPKGGAGTLVVLDPHSVAYLDLTGSGSETIAHLRENGRIVMMLCAFTGPANVVRLHGVGRVVPPADAEFAARRATRNAASIVGLPALDQRVGPREETS